MCTKDVYSVCLDYLKNHFRLPCRDTTDITHSLSKKDVIYNDMFPCPKYLILYVVQSEMHMCTVVNVNHNNDFHRICILCSLYFSLVI